MLQKILVTILIALFASVTLFAEKQKEKMPQKTMIAVGLLESYPKDNNWKNFGGELNLRRNFNFLPKTIYLSLNAGHLPFDIEGNKKEENFASIGLFVYEESVRQLSNFAWHLAMEVGALHRKQKSYYDGRGNFLEGYEKYKPMMTVGAGASYRLFANGKIPKVHLMIKITGDFDKIYASSNIGLSYMF